MSGPDVDGTEQQAATPEALKIRFRTAVSTIDADQFAVLDEAARLFRDGSPLVMIVAGSADTVGSADLNLQLSIRRAQSVAFALADRGIPIERLQVLGRGNSELEVNTANDTPNAENRSVSITWR
ncbi:MAG: OmpA family protein [Candidatus Saccharibacteria bacterium]|nr:OmpA family protein [Pseudorhodobacter sp.]